MNTFKQKALLAAVAAGLGVAGNAEAVYLNPNGLGQVLIYPYYTVQNQGTNSFNTYLSIVNTTTDAKVLKVRVREGRNSAEVIDFNLYLSRNDVWTAAIIPTDATNTSAGRLITADKSCTNPIIPAAGVDFRNFAYASDGAGAGLERTREGYVEIFEMATLTGAPAVAVTHTNSGTPANCAVVQGQTVLFATTLGAPSGGLSGTGTLINVTNGQDAGYSADALDQFIDVPNYADVLTENPNLGDAVPQSFTIGNGTGFYNTWAAQSGTTAGARAVSAVYMHTAVMNEFIMDSATLSNTDWVLTFPTKSLFVDATTAAQPFTEAFTANGACELVQVAFFNREERGAAVVPGDFSPSPPAGPANSVCWESTVISFKNGQSHTPAASATISGVLGSRNTTGVVLDGFQNGWASLTFTGAGAGAGLGAATGTSINFFTGAAGGATLTFYGLPVTGFMVRTFVNNAVACGTATCQSNYGSLFRHNYLTVGAP